MDELEKTALALVADSKGILAADESYGTMKKRFDAHGIEDSEDMRRAYRELLFTTESIEQYISGVIMFDETIHQGKPDGTPLVKVLQEKGIIPGIKVDQGKEDLVNFPGEKITLGLDSLNKRLEEYKNLGAKFAKWRAVIVVGEGLPTDTAINSNAVSLARYAAICQDKGLVPIVEPEVLMNGDHELQKTREVTYKTLKSVFTRLVEHRVNLKGILLKPNMIVPGIDSGEEVSAQDIARVTLEVFEEVVPHDVPGIVFLSGGLSPETATSYLNAMNKMHEVHWELGFSFGRALQEPVLKTWQGKPENWDKAQEAFYNRAKLNSLARRGEYDSSMEDET